MFKKWKRHGSSIGFCGVSMRFSWRSGGATDGTQMKHGWGRSVGVVFFVIEFSCDHLS